MNLAFDCGAFERITTSDEHDAVSRLTEEEKILYYKQRCIDEGTSQKLNLFKYLDTSCTECCSVYLNLLENNPALEDDE